MNWIVLKHHSDESLELLREEILTIRLVLRVYTPEGVRLVLSDSLVEGIRADLSSVERRMSRNQDEEDDGESE